MEIRTGRHCVFMLHVHLVFVTKYRRGVFTKEVIEDLRGIFAKVCTDFEAELVEFDGEDDHVHLLVNYPPKVAQGLPSVPQMCVAEAVTRFGHALAGSINSGRSSQRSMAVSPDATSSVSPLVKPPPSR